MRIVKGDWNGAFCRNHRKNLRWPRVGSWEVSLSFGYCASNNAQIVTNYEPAILQSNAKLATRHDDDAIYFALSVRPKQMHDVYICLGVRSRVWLTRYAKEL